MASFDTARPASESGPHITAKSEPQKHGSEDPPLQLQNREKHDDVTYLLQRPASVPRDKKAAATTAKAKVKSADLKIGHYTSGKTKPGKIQRAELLLLDALDVAGFGSVDADSITFVDERRNVYDETGFKSSGLHDGAGGGFLERGFGLNDFEVHGIGEVDADGFFLEEFDFDDGVGDEVVDGFAELGGGHLHLLVVFRVQEMIFVALVVEIFEFDFIEDGAFDKFFGAETIVDHGAGTEAFKARLHGAALVARSAMVGAEDGVELFFMIDDHTGA